MTRPLTVLVLTEDHSKHAPAVWKRLVALLARAVCPECDTRESLLRVEEPEPELAKAAHAQRWRERKDRTVATRLVHAIHTRIGLGHFVLFHVDGDSTWSARSDRPSVVRAFEEHIRDAVRVHLGAAPGHGQRRRGKPASVPPAASSSSPDERLTHLRLVMPYYAVESWLLQATDRARATCAKECDEHAALFDAWAADRGLLDEVEKPAEVVPCVGKDHNEELARALTNDAVGQVVAAEKSLHAAVEHLRASAPFVAALRATVPGQDPPSGVA